MARLGEGAASSPVHKASRMVAFTEERLHAWRREFAVLWLARDGRAALPAAHAAAGDAFVADMEAQRARVLRARRALDGLEGKGPIEALTVARGIEAEPFAAAMAALEEQARALRGPLGLGAARPATAQTGRLAAPAAERPRGGFLDRLKKLGEPPAVEALSASPAPAPSKAGLAFDAAFELVQGVLSYVGPRLAVVDVAMEATGLPARRRPWEQVTGALPALAAQAGLPAPHHGWLPPMATLFHRDMGAVQRAHGALVQWKETRALHAEAERVAAVEPADRREVMLAGFDLARYRAAVYPISHLHVTFKGVSPLSDFFPAP